jgi:hypothetical protein
MVLKLGIAILQAAPEPHALPTWINPPSPETINPKSPQACAVNS